MKKLFAILMSASIIAGSVQAQVPNPPTGTFTSPNLVYMTTNPWQSTTMPNPGTWANTFDVTTSNGGGTSGGNRPGYNNSTGTFMFGYTTASVGYTYALSQALQNSGMTFLGYNYKWDYLNEGYSAGTLSGKLTFTGIDSSLLYSKTWNMGTTNGWTTMSGTETFLNNGTPASQVSNFQLTFTGKDNRFWAGYYGPQVRNPSISLNYTFDACSSNPLSSPTCPGYAQALLTQQCTANPLYDASCPGYAQALLTQQCTADALSNPQCPGYAAAYLTYQCNANPLYSTACPGYEQAYFNQQCTANPLYNTSCPGYATAYFNQQCNLNGLYDQKCPNYATAYAKKMVLEQQGIASTVATAGVVASTAPTTTTVSNEGTVSSTPSSTGNTTVDKAIAPTTTTANSAAAPAAPVQLVQPAPAPAAPQQQAQQEKKPDGPKQEGQGGQQPMQAQGPQGGEKPQPTARQQLAERRQEAAKKEAVEKGKNLANEVGKAESMEKQKEIQNVVIQAMGFTPGFDTYGKVFLPDTMGYKQFTVYNNQKNVDNARLGRGLFGPTDRLHNELVESQYK